MAFSISSYVTQSAGSEVKAEAVGAADSSYPTNGYTINASSFGLRAFTRVVVANAFGYHVEPIYGSDLSSIKLKFYSVTPAGTISAPVFTGSALSAHGHNVQITQDEVVSVTAGTGVSAALANIPVGSVDNVYIAAGGVTGAAVKVPVGSVANSKEVSIDYTTGVLQFLVADAVTSAKVTYARAAVSTTSAGTPAGSNSAPTFTGTAGAMTEVANATNLSALSSIKIDAYGYL